MTCLSHSPPKPLVMTGSHCEQIKSLICETIQLINQYCKNITCKILSIHKHKGWITSSADPCRLVMTCLYSFCAIRTNAIGIKFSKLPAACTFFTLSFCYPNSVSVFFVFIQYIFRFFRCYTSL